MEETRQNISSNTFEFYMQESCSEFHETSMVFTNLFSIWILLGSKYPDNMVGYLVSIY